MSEKLLNATKDLLSEFVSYYVKNGDWPKFWAYNKKTWHFVMNLNNVLIYDSYYEKLGVQLNDNILRNLDNLHEACEKVNKENFYEGIEKDVEETCI